MTQRNEQMEAINERTVVSGKKRKKYYQGVERLKIHAV